MIEDSKEETLQQHASEVRIDLNPGGKVRRAGRHRAGSLNEQDETPPSL